MLHIMFRFNKVNDLNRLLRRQRDDMFKSFTLRIKDMNRVPCLAITYQKLDVGDTCRARRHDKL